MPLGRLAHAAAAPDLAPLLYLTNAIDNEQAKPQHPCPKNATSSSKPGIVLPDWPAAYCMHPTATFRTRRLLSDLIQLTPQLQLDSAACAKMGQSQEQAQQLRRLSSKTALSWQAAPYLSISTGAPQSNYESNVSRCTHHSTLRGCVLPWRCMLLSLHPARRLFRRLQSYCCMCLVLRSVLRSAPSQHVCATSGAPPSCEGPRC